VLFRRDFHVLKEVVVLFFYLRFVIQIPTIGTTASDVMACVVWYELLEAWVIASRHYASSVMAAHGSEGSDFAHFRDAAEKAKAECMEAERALRVHEQTHGCVHGGIAAQRSA
jgi:hypothetical protein